MTVDLFAVKGSACVYCGVEANSVDHVIPRSLGGPSTIDNLVPACRECNTRKGDMPLEGFLSFKENGKR